MDYLDQDFVTDNIIEPIVRSALKQNQNNRFRAVADEVRSEAWVAYYVALEKVDPDKGDPVRYLRRSIRLSVSDYIVQLTGNPLGFSNGSTRQVHRKNNGTLPTADTEALNQARFAKHIAPGSVGQYADEGAVFADCADLPWSGAADVPVMQQATLDTLRTVWAGFEEDHPRQAEVIRLVDGDVSIVGGSGVRMSYDEAAEWLGVTRDSIKGQYLRGRKNLRERLRGAGVTGTDFYE